MWGWECTRICLCQAVEQMSLCKQNSLVVVISVVEPASQELGLLP